MKLVILGASGRTGKQVVEQALARGHSVTAIVRDVSRLDTKHQSLNVVVADVMNAKELAKIIKGQDAVIGTLGNNKSKLHLLERSTEALVTAMQATGLQRVILELGFGGARHARFTRTARFLNDLALGKVLADQTKAVELVRAAQLDWTIVYATVLTNGPLTNKGHVVDANETVSIRHKISRADVAAFILTSVETGALIHQMPVVSG